ncbi:hypothetical protein FLSI110296_07290 [Flavobacterium sinopsychrotolerans]|jgi:hypothetical protein|uniref:Addiction module component n=1 Tax=Flavobacterium sinopsychrotolerans TaxID=604089 RepID=A0A1H8KLK9_9FLAO|nr:hypothetical protein [Flavobacterium sinopsychrotolerans]SEN93744.1 hypothetical protein SAMN04487942_1231 [Flavobacterium sinopsychrotolerans]
MDSNSKKYKTNEKLPSVEEETVLYQSKTDLETENQDDFWDELPEQVKQLIEIGLKQSEQGLGKSHSQVMAEIKKKYNLT